MELSQDLLNEISTRLRNAKESVCTAESVTSGYIQFTFSQMEKASEFYRGGITAFSLSEKVKLLQVDRDEAEKCDCVSENIARTMAIQAANLFSTDWSLGITGYAVPVEESDFETYAFFAIAYRGNVLISDKIEALKGLQGVSAQSYYCDCVMRCLKSELTKKIT